MERLTSQLKFPLETFKRCQLCGFAKDDICEFQMWQECDDNDHLEENNLFVLCRSCEKIVTDHERLYLKIPWGQGKPGMFMLICGDCKFRQTTTCSHPSLKANGGDGLGIVFDKLIDVHVCFRGGKSLHGPLAAPAIECTGKERKEL